MEYNRKENPAHHRQWRSESGSIPSSPGISPARHHHSRSSSVTGFSNAKKTQNFAARAAAQRLAQVMASQTTEDDDEDEEDLGFSSNGSSPLSFSRNISAARVIPPPKKTSLSTFSVAAGKFGEEPLSVRSTSTGRPVLPLELPVVPLTKAAREQVPVTPKKESWNKQTGKRFPADTEGIKHTTSLEQRDTSSLQDELDMLQEENDIILEKLRLEEERCEEAEARARELEKQVEALGDGVSLEAKLLSRKEAILRQKEAAMKDAMQMKDSPDEQMKSLQSKIETSKGEVATTLAKLHKVEGEVKALHSITRRMVLSQKEMEEVVLKRCWLARYWSLAAQHGICADIAASKQKHWSSLAPLPFEVVISAGQKAKEEYLSNGNIDADRKNVHVQDVNDVMEGNIESILSVEMGLRELASLKVEDAVILAFAQQRRPNSLRPASDMKSSGDSNYLEVFELNPDESEDVLFKEAWLTYFWARARSYGIEEKTANEKLLFWISHAEHSPNSQDAVDVEQGLSEMRKLGMERRLWDASRKEIE